MQNKEWRKMENLAVELQTSERTKLFGVAEEIICKTKNGEKWQVVQWSRYF